MKWSICGLAVVLPVHYDDMEEYRVRRERDALLKSLGIGQDQETGSIEASSISQAEVEGRVRGAMPSDLKRSPDLAGESFQASMLRLLRVVVLQNELLLRLLRLREGPVKDHEKQFDPVDWK